MQFQVIGRLTADVTTDDVTLTPISAKRALAELFDHVALLERAYDGSWPGQQ